MWFGQVLDPMKKTYFLKFFIREIRVYSRISVWKPNFFPRQAIPKILFVSDSRCTGETPYWNWFDLKKFLTRRKRPIFKIRYSRNSQISYEILTFFLHKLYRKILLFQTLVSQGILHTEIVSVWITSWPFQKDLFLKLFFGNNRKFPYETLTFYYASHCENFFCFNI